jgi:hypothetical protein
MSHRVFWICAMFVVLAAQTVQAQPQLNHPDQFYSNGEKVNAWTTNADAKLMSTFWFVKNPKNSLNYQQMIAIVYDNEPGLIYYYGVAEKKFVGRFEIENQKYSMLKPQDRRQKKTDIPPGAFPPADEMPSVGDMLPPPTEGEANDDEMMMPPPTMQFPQFENSIWDSFYATPQGKRVKARIVFNGNQGNYQPEGSDSEGELSNVVYQMQANRVVSRFAAAGSWAGPAAFSSSACRWTTCSALRASRRRIPTPTTAAFGTRSV